MTIKNLMGFSNLRDLGTTIFLSTQFGWIFAIIAGLSTFITKYVWADTTAIYFLYTLFLIDFCTGIIKALFFTKDFCSKKLPRVLVSLLTYSLLIGISFNCAKHSVLFIWMPQFIWGFSLSVQIISILENLFIMKLIPSDLYWSIKKKINALTKEDKENLNIQ